jgi:hypothetical protein
LTPPQFEAQIRFLSKFLDFISPADIWSSESAANLPDRPVLLTFDDGTRGLLDHALPVLKEHGIQSLCFVGMEHHRAPTRPYWWDLAEGAYENPGEKSFPDFLQELRKEGSLASAGRLQKHAAKVASHLFPMDEEGLKRWAGEGQFLASHGNVHDPVALWDEASSDPQELQKLAGPQFSPAIAYPYGELPEDQSVSGTVKDRLEKQGFRSAFGTWAGFTSLNSLRTLGAKSLPRLVVPSQWSNARLAAKIAVLALKGAGT